MALTEMCDLSFVDVDELGVRPNNGLDEGNAMDFDDPTSTFFPHDKSFEIVQENLVTSDEDFDYEIDPETGEKIFRDVVITSSPSLSSSSPSNYLWIEEYLAAIPPSNSSHCLERPSEFLFEPLPERLWTADIYSPTMMDSKAVLRHQNTAPIFISSTHSNPYNHLCSISVDDEHSTSSSSNGSQRQRYQSSIESDSTTPEREFSFIETKLEKFDREQPHLIQRRSSTRTLSQGQQDEAMLRRYHIPLTVLDITQSSTEEYNRHLTRLNHLTAEQMHIIKDIRRRGKNKIAAQNCRKRKATNVETLQEEVDDMKRYKKELEERKRSFQRQIAETRDQYEYLHRQVLPDRQLLPAIFVK